MPEVTGRQPIGLVSGTFDGSPLLGAKVRVLIRRQAHSGPVSRGFVSVFLTTEVR